MMEQMLAPENLPRPWHRVRPNAGAPGVDGMTVAAFPGFCREQWLAIRSALMARTCRPAAERRVFIPKPDGSQRPLNVPTVLDRQIQQALAQVLTPLVGEVLVTTALGSVKAAAPTRRCGRWKPDGKRDVATR